MQISLLSDDKLKIYLKNSDFEDLNFDSNDLKADTIASRQFLISILEFGKAETCFSPRGEKILVEIYHDDAGGCAIMYTCVKQRSFTGSDSLSKPTVFEFESAGDLIAAAINAYTLYRFRIFASSLYIINDTYRLVVNTLDFADRLSIFLLSEYGNKLDDNDLVLAFTQEHGKLIIPDNAIEVIYLMFH